MGEFVPALMDKYISVYHFNEHSRERSLCEKLIKSNAIYLATAHKRRTRLEENDLTTCCSSVHLRVYGDVIQPNPRFHASDNATYGIINFSAKEL